MRALLKLPFLVVALASMQLAGCGPSASNRESRPKTSTNSTEAHPAGSTEKVAQAAPAKTDAAPTDSSTKTIAAAPQASDNLPKVNTELPKVNTETAPKGNNEAAPKANADAVFKANPAAAAPEASATAAVGAGKALAAAVDKKSNAPLKEGDWNQWLGSSYRNNVPVTKDVPLEFNPGKFDRKTGEWQPETAKNIKWVAQLGSQSYGNATVAAGKVFVGTNNQAGYLKRYPSTVDLGCLLAFRETDGKFLWQHSSEKLPTGRVHDWMYMGICCAPLIEGNRLWFVTSRGEVRCLDTEGFYDGEDDGPVMNEWARSCVLRRNETEPADDKQGPALKELAAGKLHEALLAEFKKSGIELPTEIEIKADEPGKRWTFSAKLGEATRQFKLQLEGPSLVGYQLLSPADTSEADVVWVVDMMKELGISQHNMCSCSVASWGDMLLVITGNGVHDDHITIPAPEAPSFLALDKLTGKVLWSDHSPGNNIVHGQWTSPTVGTMGGVPQILFGGGDGILYSFKAEATKELLWQFDVNLKEFKWELGGRGIRNDIIATPVIYDGLVYLAVGQDPEHGEGPGRLWCIDPTKRGDISTELAVHISDRTKPIPHKRIQAVEKEKGEIAIDNPNSGALWCYQGEDINKNGKLDFEETMHRSCGTVAIKNDLLFIADFSGLFHCLDAKTGKLHWTYDMLAASWGSPLIVNDHVFIGDEDGDVAVFKISSEKHDPIFEVNMGSSVYSTPIVANGVLYISSKDRLFAIEAPGTNKAEKK